MGTWTEHYSLHQWEAEDSFLRTDFNEDNAKIDAALTTLSTQLSGVGYLVGQYVGNGSYPRTIELGFQPKAVMLTTHTGYTNLSGSVYGGVFGVGAPLQTYAEVTATGFTLKGDYTNQRNAVYNYIAFK